MRLRQAAIVLVAPALLAATREDATGAIQRARSAVEASAAGPSRSAAEGRLQDAATALAEGRFDDAVKAVSDAERLVSQPTARVTVVVDPANGSRFLVREGSVEVTSGRTTTVAVAGEMVTASVGGPPIVEKIPVRAPKLIEPGEGSAIDWDDLLRWDRPEGAQKFQVWISRDPLFRDRVSLLAADGASITVDPDLETGTYWWRVAAVSREGMESLPSDARSFRLAPDPDAHLYWVRHVSRACAKPCPKWLAVDAENGAERAVADVDLGLLGLERAAEDHMRAQLLAGEMAVHGSIRPGTSPDRAVLVVSGVRGVSR